MSLYSQGILGLSKTARLAGLSRWEMNRLLDERKVPMHYGSENSQKIYSIVVLISDSSPSFCLAAIRYFSLLRFLNSKIFTPEAV